ncbi:hypothetical protein G9A89_018980 [Geosiphon pyriformis]|nr:hypothetical protein G9A89_018980 [Geosiphon pyriformis]
MDMELASLVASGSGSTSAGLRTQPDIKKKRVNSVYSHNASYKKLRNLKVDIRVVDLSAGLLGLANIGDVNGKFLRSWGSEMKSEVSSMSSLSDLENLKNTITEKTSYVDLDTSVVDNMEDDTTLRKTCICTYMLGKPPKTLLFNVLSNNDDMVAFLSFKSCASEKCIFNPVKSFTLDIGISALPDKTIGNKLIAVKKLFYQVNSFGSASALSKFPDIIRSFFISELSLIKAKELAVSKKILVNINVRKSNIYLNQKVIVKEILVDFPRSVIESVFSKFGYVILIRMQLIGLWQKALIEFKSSDVGSLVASKWSVLVMARDCHQAWLYTLSIGTTAHDLSDLVNSYGEKTCFIGRNPSFYVYNRCAIVCFADKATKSAAISSVSVYKSVNLHWAGLSLAHCAKYECFGHISDMCLVGENSEVHHRQVAPVVCLVFFGRKTWAQVASGLSFCVFSSVPFGADSTLSAKPLVVASDSLNNSGLTNCMASLECSMEILLDQVSEILRKLSFVELVPISSSFCVILPVVASFMGSDLNLDMAVDSVIFGFDKIELFVFWFGFIGSFSISMTDLIWKIATCNVRGINNPTKQVDIICWHKEMNNLISIVTETKLKDKIHPWIINRFDGVHVFTSEVNSGYLNFGMAIIIDTSLACHVYKVSKVPGQILCIRLLFKNKLSVSILGLYAGASSVVQFSQAGNINFLITKAVNESSFVIFGGDFNKNGSHKCASFKKCFDLGLVNSLAGSAFVKIFTWCNSHGIAKTIDYVFVFSNLVNAMVDHNIAGVVDYFDIDHAAISVFVGLGGLLDVQLSSLHKQANKNCWKYDIKGVDKRKWCEFRNAIAANAAVFLSVFKMAERSSDLDAM